MKITELLVYYFGSYSRYPLYFVSALILSFVSYWGNVMVFNHYKYNIIVLVGAHTKCLISYILSGIRHSDSVKYIIGEDSLSEYSEYWSNFYFEPALAIGVAFFSWSYVAVNFLFYLITYNLLYVAPLITGIFLFFQPTRVFQASWSSTFALRSTTGFFTIFAFWLIVSREKIDYVFEYFDFIFYSCPRIGTLWVFEDDVRRLVLANVQDILQEIDFIIQYFFKTSLLFDHSIFVSDMLFLGSENGWDSLSMVFVGLTTFIFPLCIMSNWDFFNIASPAEIKIYLCSLIFLEYFIINAFITKNIFFFYMFFESTLLPMILLIGIWGPTPRKIKASYYLVFYTLGGSILFLFAILVIIVERGTADMEQLIILGPARGDLRLQLFLWCCISLAFAVKMPIFPFHIWLPEAHVEAPTVGSVILAALLLKLGGYGFIRFIPIFPYAYVYFMPLMYTLGVVSILYASLITIRQIDLKKIIAYSSVAHMNLGTIGIFSLNLQGLQGSIFLMVSHGVVSSALFFLVGMLYARKSSKLLPYYGGLVIKMPIFTTFFFFFSLANLAFPGTANFVGELLVLIGASESNMSIMVLAASGMLFSSLYSIWLFNRLCFGYPKDRIDKKNLDMSQLEFYYMFPLLIATLLLGLCPSRLLEYTWLSMKITLQYLKFN